MKATIATTQRSLLLAAGGLAAFLQMPMAAIAQAPALVPPSPNWARAMPPAPDMRVKITEEYARQVGRDAYFWAWPMVNMYNRRLHFVQVKEIDAAGTVDGGARQSPCDAHRLCRSRGARGRVSKSGCGLRHRRACARCLASGGPGAGFRRPLLGLSGRRSPHRQLRPARQDV